MQRREALALLGAGAVPLAGCSSGDGDDGTNESPSTNGTTPTDNSTEDPADEPTDGNETEAPDDGNTTDPSDDGNTTDPDDSDGSDGEDDTDEEDDSEQDDDDEPEGPTEEELAQNDIDSAQTELQNVVDDTISEGTGDSMPAVDASISGFSDGLVEARISNVQTAISDAKEHERTSEQKETIGALESVLDWHLKILDAQDPLNDAYLEAHYALEDWHAEDRDADLTTVRNAADEAESLMGDIVYTVERELGSDVFEHVDALSYDVALEQSEWLDADLQSVRDIASRIESLEAAEDDWDAGVTHMEAADYDDFQEHSAAADDFETGTAAFESISSGGLSGRFSAAANYIDCYTGEMRAACERGETAAIYYTTEDYEEAQEIYEEAQSERSAARDCSLDWSA